MTGQDQNNPSASGSPASNDKCGAELLGLLGELGSQEDRTLLTGLKNWREPRRLKTSDLLQERSPWLSNLEKHILAVHRDELGLLFYDACARKLLATNRAAGGVVFQNPEVHLDPGNSAGLAAWRSAAQAGRERVTSIAELSDPLDVLDRLLLRSTTTGVSLLAIAEAGYVVRPSESLLMFLAHGVEAAGDVEAAKRRFLEVHEHPGSNRNRLIAAADVGRLAGHCGDTREALHWYALASSGGEYFPVFACSWALFALQEGDARSWSKVVGVIEDTYDKKDPAFHHFCQRLVAGRLSGSWSPTPKAVEFVREIDPGESDHVQKLIQSSV